MISIPHPLSEVALRVARHEAGHWVIGSRLGFPCNDIMINIIRADHYIGSAAVIVESDLSSLDQIKSYARRRIVNLYAGAVAESLNRDGSINDTYALRELRERGATNDFKGAREVIRILRGVTYGAPPSDEAALQKQLSAIDEELYGVTRTLVKEDSELIVKLATLVASEFKTPGHKFGLSGRKLNRMPEVMKWKASLPPPVV